jgi:predicted phage terminase large subunit-like protein
MATALRTEDIARLPAEKQARARQLLQRLHGGEMLADFIRRLSPYRPPPRHFEPVIRLIERAARGEQVRAAISMPPRHGKTTLFQHAFPWWLTRAPADTCGYFSYSDTQARSKSRVAREIAVRSGIKLAEDSASTAEWRTPVGGGLLAGGIGGGLTGKGVSGLMMVDDPYKNRKEADSDLIREQVWEWFTEVVMTRLEGASVFVVHTRWHPDDLIGRLEKQGDWEIVNLPALAEENDPLGREFGEALWPERYPVRKLEKIRKILGEFSFAALYQGRPRPRGAKVFGEPHYYDPATTDFSECRAGIGADPAASEKTSADYSAAVAGRFRGSDEKKVLYIREVYRHQVQVPQFVNDLRAMQDRNDNCSAAVEGAGIGKAVVQTLKAVDPNLRVKESPAVGDKFQRAQGVAAAWNDGRVLVPLGSPPWLKVFLKEVSGFTGVRDDFDDQVDGLSHLWNADEGDSTDYTGRTMVAPRRI